MSDELPAAKSRVAALTARIESAGSPTECLQLMIDRAREYEGLKDHPASVKDWLEALDLAERPEDRCYIQSRISLALLEQGEREQALWWALATIESEPQSAEAQHIYGLNCLLSEFDKTAVAAFRRALEIAPDHLLARRGLAKALREDGKLVDSLAEFKKVVDDSPNDPQAHFDLAFTARLDPRIAGGCETAVEHFRKALSLGPDNALRERIERNLRELLEE